MKRKLTAGQTSVSLPIFIQDTSSTTGGGLSGLTSGTSGLVAEYRRRGQSSWTAITLTSKTLGTWTSGGFVADGALNGAYELDLPDAVCASGARWVAVRLRGATNMLPCLIEIELDVVDYQTAWLTSLGTNAPAGWINAAAIAAAALNGKGDWLTSLGTNAPTGWINAAAIAAAALNGKGDWSKAGDQMSLTSTILTQLFADADVTDLVNQISAKFDDVADLPIITIANACRDAILNRVVAGNHDTAGSVGNLLQFLDALVSSRLSTLGANAPTGWLNAAAFAGGALNGKGDWLTGLGANAPAGWINAPAIAAAAMNGKGDWFTSGSYSAPDNTGIAAIAAVLAALTEVVSSVTRFKASALTQSPVSAGGLTTDQNTKLTQIHDAIYPPTPTDEPLVIVPSAPDHVTGWAVCIGLDGQAAAGIVVTYKLQSPPPRDSGRIFNGATTGSSTSASNGLIQFAGLVPGATYYFTCGASQVSVTIPLDADPLAGYQLPSFTKT